MDSIQEPEVQFAQRLASNEKPIRTKALKKLRKYINVRSQKNTGGFTGDELLKLWKGLFYCLWMQDKPLLQEELSKQISTLIHSFYDITGQMLYLESFMQTFKREWNGIDRLRMDKFFQLVRFMFRQAFELLKKQNWDSSMVEKFLELLTAQVLQSGSLMPSGLQFHILDLYMTELAAVGSAELTAQQNLIFIEPFLKTAAKTKDRILFRTICSSIFSTIIDQAPFAIEDLMNEIKSLEDSESGQTSEEDDNQLEEKKCKPLGKKGKQVNGCTSEEEDHEDDHGLNDLEDLDTELPHGDIGPVLQFDYAALAGKLFELASRGSTPSHNRQKLYRIIKVLRDLSEGIFPQDKYPEEVSTDEDDEMFGSRKRVKRVLSKTERDEKWAPAAKKIKGKKKEASTVDKQNCDFGKDTCEQPVLSPKNKKRRKKKKVGQGQSAGGEENLRKSDQGQTVQAQSIVTDTEGDLKSSQAEDFVTKLQGQSSISCVKVTDRATPQGLPEPLPHSPVKKQVSITEESSQPLKSCIIYKDQSESSFKKTKRNGTSGPKSEVTEMEEELQSVMTSQPKVSFVSVSAKKKSLRAELQTNAKEQITAAGYEASQEETTTPAKKKNKSLDTENKPEEIECKSQANGLKSEDGVTLVQCEDSAGGTTTWLDEPADAITPGKKKSKKKSPKFVKAHKVGIVSKPAAEITSEALPLNEKTKKNVKQEEKVDQENEEKDQISEHKALRALTDKSTALPLKKKKTKPKDQQKCLAGEDSAEVEPHQGVDDEKLLFEMTMSTPAMKKKKSHENSAIEDQTPLQVVGIVDGEPSLDESDGVLYSRKPSKKKRKIPVMFEYEADELEKTENKPRKAKKTKTGNSNATVTTKGSPRSLLSSKKKSQTPISESKKVTFGLKNNKTAEFKRTDRSLLVSPDGSSRVPFDPKQRPKFGVLKSPPTPLLNRKTSSDTPKRTPKRRPSAADFF